jgi:hypothetical protein
MRFSSLALQKTSTSISYSSSTKAKPRDESSGGARRSGRDAWRWRVRGVGRRSEDGYNRTFAEGLKTRDVGGRFGTRQFADAVTHQLAG